MVGVAGASQGCATCRRRKVKCGLEKPECDRCVRSGRRCEGYQRFPVFINRDARGLQRKKRLEEVVVPSGYHGEDSQSDRTRSSASSVSCSQKQSQEPADKLRSSIVDTPLPRESIAPVLVPVPTTRPSPTLPPSMNNANLYEMNFMGIFYENYVPSDPTARKDYNEWLRGAMYVNDYDSNPALKVSLRALAVTRIGRLTKNNSLVVQGQVAYGNALKLLQYSLWDSQAMYSDSTLAAGRVLSCFEMFESNPSSANGWLGHQGGTARLVYLRGPEKYRETMKTGILDDFRYGLMISSLMTRQRSYLADPEWKTVPWRDTPKSFDDKLYDIGFSLGAAFEGFDDTLRFIDVEEAQTSLDKFTGLERDIRDWFEELAADDPTQALYWTTGSALSGPTYPAYTPNATDSKAQLPPLQFQTLLKAHQTILYWALRIIISALISTCLTFLHNHSAPLPSSIPGSASPSPPSPRHHHTSDTAALQKTLTNQRTHRLHLCALITRSVPYCLSDLWGSVGPSRCIFPLGVAIRELWRKSEVEDCEKELLQCAMELFGSISGGKGFGFAAAIGESADLYDVAPVLPVRYVDN